MILFFILFFVVLCCVVYIAVSTSTASCYIIPYRKEFGLEKKGIKYIFLVCYNNISSSLLHHFFLHPSKAILIPIYLYLYYI